MAFERTVRHVNAVKDECATHSYVITDPVIADATVSAEPTSLNEFAASAKHDPEVEIIVTQSAADIAEMKKQEEIAKKNQVEIVKLMANQRKLQRAKEKRESRIKEQLDSISVSDAEQRYARVQLNKTASVSRNLKRKLLVIFTASNGWFICSIINDNDTSCRISASCHLAFKFLNFSLKGATALSILSQWISICRFFCQL